MPELPDLEVFSQNLTKLLKGKKLQSLKQITRTTPAWNKAIKDQPLKKVYREGKELRFELGNEHILGMHLMLHGELHFSAKGEKVPRAVATFYFTDGSTLTLADFQKQARLSLDPEPSDVPDALSREFNARYLQKICEGSKLPVKKLMMDQHLVRGIGNAYADEICWDAKISPFSIAGKIPEEQVKALARSVKKILKAAIRKISKQRPGIIAGEKRDEMAVHNQHRTEDPHGDKIIRETLNGRGTYYTKAQKLYK